MGKQQIRHKKKLVHIVMDIITNEKDEKENKKSISE